MFKKKTEVDNEARLLYQLLWKAVGHLWFASAKHCAHLPLAASRYCSCHLQSSQGSLFSALLLRLRRRVRPPWRTYPPHHRPRSMMWSPWCFDSGCHVPKHSAGQVHRPCTKLQINGNSTATALLRLGYVNSKLKLTTLNLRVPWPRTQTKKHALPY